MIGFNSEFIIQNFDYFKGTVYNPKIGIMITLKVQFIIQKSEL